MIKKKEEVKGGPGPLNPLAVASASSVTAMGCRPVSAPPTPMIRSNDRPSEHRPLVFGDKVLFPTLVPTSCVQAAPGTLQLRAIGWGVGGCSCAERQDEPQLTRLSPPLEAASLNSP